MAKLLIFLACLIVVLNGMTFLLVVELEGQPELGKGSSDNVRLQKLDSLAQSIKQTNKSISQISKKLSNLERTVTGLKTSKTNPQSRSSRLKYAKKSSSPKRPVRKTETENDPADEEAGESSDSQSDEVLEDTEEVETKDPS